MTQARAIIIALLLAGCCDTPKLSPHEICMRQAYGDAARAKCIGIVLPVERTQ